ncbi:hypothetical protein VTO42DRAFT_4644 [Malbranchea cinnamomea]
MTRSLLCSSRFSSSLSKMLVPGVQYQTLMRGPTDYRSFMVNSRPGSTTPSTSTCSKPLPTVARRNNSSTSCDDGRGTITTNLTQLSSGKLTTVTICRPRKLNALNSHLLRSLPATLHDLADTHPDLIAVVLTGEGQKSFVGGADIAEMASISSPADARAFIERVHEACRSIRDCPVPVIARVNGIALGAGLEIAAACDVRVASSNAILGMPEVRLGLPSVVEAALLPRLIGWGRARQLLLLGDTIKADEALRWGLVEKVVEPDVLDQAVMEWASSLEKCGPAAVRNQKALMRRWEELGVDGAIQASIDHFGQAFEEPSQGGGSGGSEPEPVRMMGEFLKRQSQRKKNKL